MLHIVFKASGIRDEREALDLKPDKVLISPINQFKLSNPYQIWPKTEYNMSHI